MDELKVIEHKGLRVLTTQQLAEAYGTTTDSIIKNFNRNKDRYIEGKHYLALDGIDKNTFVDQGQFVRGLKNAKILYLWTEKGAFLHAKSLNTDTAWEVYDRLVESYFRHSQSLDRAALSPELQMFLKMGEAMAKQEIEQKRLAGQVEAHEKAIDGIKDAVMPVIDNWREEMQRKFNRIQHSSGIDFRSLWSEMYVELDRRAGSDISTRLRNRKERMRNEGYTKTAINNLNKMDIIESDKKLREIFSKIVTEYEIRYCS